MLSKANRLKGKANFDKVFKKGEKFYSPYFVIYILKDNPLSAVTGSESPRIIRPPRVGFVASKKVGGSVERNRARRMLSEAIRLSIYKLQSNSQIIIIALHTTVTASASEIQSELAKISF
jgi:ribonuclease P protein component